MAEAPLATLESTDPAPAPGPRATTRTGRLRWAAAVPLLALTGVSALLRLDGRDLSLWVDEGISVGIASLPLVDIPAALALDGSPPLYYALLHVWMEVFGSSAGAIRAMSLVFALATVPVAYWAGRRLLSARAGALAAVLAAASPYLTVQSREARMYSLLVLVALVAVTTFLGAFALGRRRWLPGFAASLAAVLYTHHWGLFLAAGLVVAAGWCVATATRPRRRRLALDAALAFGAAAMLYAPWIPTLVGQVRRTGAPWSRTPALADASDALASVLGGRWPALVLAVALIAAVFIRRAPDGPTAPEPPDAPETPAPFVERRFMSLLVAILAVTVATSWLASQVSPAWSPRYFGIYLPVLLVLGGLALACWGRAGLVGLGIVVVLWTLPLPFVADGRRPGAPVPKSNVESLSVTLAGLVAPGDVVLSAQMEQVPLLAYYFGPGLRYAEPSGVVTDPGVADWRDVFERMRTADPEAVLDPLVAGLEPGGHVLVVCPRLFTDAGDRLWYRLMDRHCATATNDLDDDPRVTRIWGPAPGPDQRRVGDSVAVTVYERVAS